MKSSLAPLAPLAREIQPDQAWEVAHAAWHDHGIVMLNLAEVETRRGWAAARQARNLAEQCFGKRKVKST